MKRLMIGAFSLGLAVSSAAGAQVRLIVRPDGSKVISNVGSRSASVRGTDFIWLAKQRNRPSVYDPIIDKYCDRYEVDPILVKAVIQVESGYDPSTISEKGARGLMQLMPETARRFRVTRMHDPEQNIRGGVTYLALLLKLFSYDLRRTLAAYNAGENAVIRYGGIPPFPETQHYIQKALTVYHGRPHGVIAVTKLSGKVGVAVPRHGLKRSGAYASGGS